ncbi:MAG: sialate O-acetylesterase [Bacteroides sp.]|nr:sialate O-acetylesterase [Bacteroides sp.]
MVLQQQSSVRLWGKATPNSKVMVMTSWDGATRETLSDKSGRWLIEVSTPKAGGPYRIVCSDGEELVLENILIGEVWLCSGQSNMEMPVKGFRGQPVEGSHETIVSATADRPIRLFTVQRAYDTTERDDVTGQWLKHDSEAVAGFSATAYYFGELLQRKLGVPVGLVCASWSASKIETWMSWETLQQFLEIDLSVLQAEDFGWPAGTPTLLFNAMIKPLENMTFRGMIWYQGQANIRAPELYERLFAAWTNQNRTLFRNAAMPVYFVQQAPYRFYGKDDIEYPLFKEHQMKSMQTLPNVGMAFTTDLGDEVFIHAPRKKPVGERLAFWALAQTYGIKGFSYCGPVFRSWKPVEGKIELMFVNAEEGLNPENEQVIGFEIAGADSVFVPARAEIVNGSARVRVWHDQITDPIEVRYCFRNYIEGNLRNNAGLPAACFRVHLREE